MRSSARRASSSSAPTPRPSPSCASVLATIPGLAAADRPAVAATLALVVGGLYLGGRFLGLGVLSTFLSRPILVGFFAGISLSIITGQLKRITGVPLEADGLLAPFVELARNAGLIHWPSLALAAAMFAVLQLASALRLPVPGPVIVVVLAVALSALLDLPAHGIATVGDIPSDVPALALPGTGGAGLDQLLLGAVAIFLVSFAAGIVTARSFGERGGYPVDADREMLGFGAANIAAGLFARLSGHRLGLAHGDQRLGRRTLADRRRRRRRDAAR